MSLADYSCGTENWYIIQILKYIYFPRRKITPWKNSRTVTTSAIQRTGSSTSCSTKEIQSAQLQSAFPNPPEFHLESHWCHHVCRWRERAASQTEPVICVPLAVGAHAVDTVDRRWYKLHPYLNLTIPYPTLTMNAWSMIRTCWQV